jgi:hypothetical protein
VAHAFEMTGEAIYIAAEDEVPEVIERVRGIGAEDVRLVLPPGARLACSRFSFQLLNQYAARLGKRVSIVSPDPAVQQMARESGFDSFVDVEHRHPMAPDLRDGPLSVARAEPAPFRGPVAGGGRTRPVGPPRPVPATPDARAALPGGPQAGSRTRTEPPSLRGFTLPGWLRSPTASGHDRLFLYGGAATLLAVGIVAMAILAPSASVTLVAQAQPFAGDVQVDAQPGSGAVAVRTQTSQKTVSTNLQATGTRVSPGQAAKGQVVFTNNCPFGRGALQLKPGQEVLTSDGRVFVVEADSGAIAEGGSATVPVHADKSGNDGNVGANQITTIANAGIWAGCLQVTNPQPTGGGQDGQTATVVSQADIQQARTVLDQQARQQITSDLQGRVRGGEKLGDPVVYQAATFSADHKADDTVKTFNATLTEQGEGAYYSTDDVTRAFAEQLKTRVPSGQQLVSEGVQADYQVAGAAGGHLTFKGKASGYIAPAIDREAVRRQLPGKPVGQAKALLQRLPVRDVRIRQFPFPLPVMPFFGSRIDLTYKIQSG